MSTRSSARSLFPPLDNLELTIQRRSRTDHTLLNDFEMAAEGNDDLLVPDLRTMEELCHPSLNCRGDDANKHLDKFLHVTQSIKVNEVTDDALRLYLFPHSLTHHATAWNSINTFEQMAKMFLGKYFPPSMMTKLRKEITNFRQRPDESLFEAWGHYKLLIDRCPNHNMLPATQIDTFYNGLTLRHRDTINATAGGTFMKRGLEECYDLVENMTTHHNDWDTSAQRTIVGNTQKLYVAGAYQVLKAEMAEINKNLIKVFQIKQQVKAVTHSFETYGGPHSYNDCPVTVGQTQNVYPARAYNQGGPTIPTTSSPPKVVEREIEMTKDTVPPTNNGRTKDVQPPVVQVEIQIPNSEPVVSPVVAPVEAPVSAPKPNLKPLIPYPSRLLDQKLCDKANDQKEKLFQIFQDLNFHISFADALILMPKLGPTIRSLLINKEKLFELPRTPLNEHCSMVLLKKLSRKAGRPRQISHPVRDLIDVYKRELTLRVGNKSITFNLNQTLRYSANYDAELINQIDMNTTSSLGSGTLPGNTITNPKEDLKGITTHNGTAYQGPMIPTTSSSLPQVVERETKVTKDSVPPTNNGSTKDVQPPVVQIETPILNSEPVFAPIIELVVALVSAPKPNQKPSILYPSRLHDQKLRDKSNDQKENFFQIFQDLNFNISFVDALILMPNPTQKVARKLGDPGKFLIPCDFLGMDECLTLADLDASINLMPLSVWNKLSLHELSPMCMTLELADRWISRPVGVAEDVFVKVGTFHFLADFVVVDFDVDLREYSQEVLDFFDLIMSGNPTLYYDPIVSTSSPTLTPFVELKICEDKNEKSSIDEPPEVELKDLPPHLEYAFLEGGDKLPVIIAKDFSDEEKIALITILIDGDFEPAVQHQRRVNPKIHDVIKKEDLKLLDAGLIYPISNSPLVSPVHCLQKKGGFTVVENEENELILTRLVMGWRVCIDYNQEKTTFTFPYGTFAYRHMPFGLCNAPGTFQRIEVDKAKVNVIAKLPHPTTVKGIPSFLGHASFYRRFIKYFSKIARPMTRLLEKDTPFFFSKECVKAFQTLKRKLTEAPILIAPDWDLPFELMCDASDFSIGVVLGQRQEKYFRPIHYAIKTMTEAESNDTTTKKEMLVVVYAFDKIRSYLIMNKSIMYTNHSALKYLFAKKDSKARLLYWVLLIHEFKFKVIDTKGAENLAADHLSRLENPHQNVLDPKEINESFPLETLNMVSFHGKAPTKGSKNGKSVSTKELVEKSAAEVVMDDADMLDWNNPEGDHYPFDLSKPVPLQSHPSHLTIAVDYFFNINLKYLKSSDPERTYNMSITKTKAARYKIEDMVPTLWSPTKVGYDKDALKRIKH
nr:reverse transcriptase domain-containing protein [Tanacetum cinerariifolium]